MTNSSYGVWPSLHKGHGLRTHLVLDDVTTAEANRFLEREDDRLAFLDVLVGPVAHPLETSQRFLKVEALRLRNATQHLCGPERGRC